MELATETNADVFMEVRVTARLIGRQTAGGHGPTTFLGSVSQFAALVEIDGVA